MKKAILLVVILALGLTATAQAQGQVYRDGSWSFTVQTRYAPSQDISGEGGSSVAIQDDLGWGFGFSHFLSEKFSLGMLFSWRSAPYTATIVDQGDPSDKRYYSSTLTTSTIGLAGMWLPLTGRWTPYVNGGIGWSIVDSNIPAYGYGGGCWWDPWWGPVCSGPATYGTDTASFELGVGVQFQAGDSFFLRAGYDYMWVDVGSYDGTSMFRFDLGWLN